MAGTWEELHVHILKELEQLNARMTAFDSALASINIKDAKCSVSTKMALEQLRKDLRGARKSMTALNASCEAQVSSVEESVTKLTDETTKQGKDIVRFNVIYKIAIAVITAVLIALAGMQIKSCDSSTLQHKHGVRMPRTNLSSGVEK